MVPRAQDPGHSSPTRSPQPRAETAQQRCFPQLARGLRPRGSPLPQATAASPSVEDRRTLQTARKQEAEAGGLPEPGASRTAWAVQPGLTFNGKTSHI